jgi:hypothetical protein
MKYRIAKKIAQSRYETMYEVRHTIAHHVRAIARLRKAWRHKNPLRTEEGGHKSRSTGLSNNGDPRLSNGRVLPRRWTPDYFYANQLASRYYRLQYLIYRDFGHWPYPNAEIYGRPRSLQ